MGKFLGFQQVFVAGEATLCSFQSKLAYHHAKGHTIFIHRGVFYAADTGNQGRIELGNRQGIIHLLLGKAIDPTSTGNHTNGTKCAAGMGKLYLDATRTSAGSGYSDMPITHIIGMVLIAIGIIPFVLKLLHMVKGWKLCDVLCIFIDIAVAGFAISYIILPGTAQGESILFLIPLVVSLGALVSNIKSLRV